MRVRTGKFVQRSLFCDALIAALERDKKVSFDVAVTMSDAEGKEVATMRVSWTVKAVT